MQAVKESARQPPHLTMDWPAHGTLEIELRGAHGGTRSGPAIPNWRYGGRSREADATRKRVAMLGGKGRKLADR